MKKAPPSSMKEIPAFRKFVYVYMAIGVLGMILATVNMAL